MANPVAPGIYRLGTKWIGWYLIEDGGRLTVVDAGLRGYWHQLPELLASIGATLGDIEAVLLTHRHIDHIGNAERIRREAAVPVYVHTADAPLTLQPDTSPPRAPLWRLAVLRYAFHIIRNGGPRVTPVAEVAEFADGETIDVPGRPRVIHAPGHTAGNCALHLADRSVLIAGDVLANMDAYTGSPGLRIAPSFVNDDSEQALASLDRLEGLEAETVVFGHGEPWHGGIPEALAAARKTGIV